MSEQEEAPDLDVEERDTPEPEAPEADAPDTADEPENPEYFSETFDPATLSDELRPAYNQMRAAFTQKTQTVAEQRKEIEQEQALLDALRSDDPELQAAALAHLGLELEDDDDLDEFEDDLDDDDLPMTKAEFKAWQQQQTDQAQQVQQAEQFEEAVQSFTADSFVELEKATGREFNEEEIQTLHALSQSIPDERGLPNVAAAYEAIYANLLPQERQRWVTSKQSPQPGSGQSGSPVVDLSNTQSRRAEMARIMDAASDD